MNDDIVNQITLKYLLNKDYRNCDKETSKLNKKDKKFYRRRVLNLTQELFLNKSPDNLFPDVKNAFDNYINSCVNYFKITDESDIIQEDYIEYANSIPNPINSNIMMDDVNAVENSNKLMMRLVKTTKPPLSDFVKITLMKPVVEPILPKQKNIELNTPQLKNKGISKKKNVDINNETQVK
jgi:hypothetical protein